MQEKIAQNTNTIVQPTIQQPVVNQYSYTDYLFSPPTAIVMISVALLSALFLHLFTKKRDYDKVRADVMKEFEVKYMTVNFVETLKDVNENIRKNNEKIDGVESSLKTEIKEGFKQVNRRIDNLLKGIPPEQK
jgi:hypothetical protein